MEHVTELLRDIVKLIPSSTSELEKLALIKAMVEAQHCSKLPYDKISEGMKEDTSCNQNVMSNFVKYIHANGMRIKHIELEPIENNLKNVS